MIVERMLLTGVLAMLGVLAFTALRQTHVWRLNRVEEPGQMGETAVLHETIVAGQPTLLYFRSAGCAACPTQTRYLDQVAELWNGRVTIRKIDADAEPEMAAQFGIFTLPTTIVMDGTGAVRQINYGLTNTHKLTRQLETLREYQ